MKTMTITALGLTLALTGCAAGGAAAGPPTLSKTSSSPSSTNASPQPAVVLTDPEAIWNQASDDYRTQACAHGGDYSKTLAYALVDANPGVYYLDDAWRMMDEKVKEKCVDWTPPAPTNVAAKPKDFRLTVKITGKQCFGSAGCLIDYKIVVSNAAALYYDPSVTYDVTFEVRGGEDGPVIDTTEMTGTSYDVPTGHVSTSSSKAKITAKVTAVEAQ